MKISQFGLPFKNVIKQMNKQNGGYLLASGAHQPGGQRGGEPGGHKGVDG
jgi:hypothetical protein